MRFIGTLALASLVIGSVACSASPASSAAPPATPPSPFLTQYVGEYDAAAAGGVQQLLLHIDGSFEAVVDGQTAGGTFAGSGATRDASATLTTGDGRTFTATFRSVFPASGAPPQSFVDLASASGPSTSLASSWIAGSEAMCDATQGTWHDDDPDPATGLDCTCGEGHLYMPSRGGCVQAGGSSDPQRLPLPDDDRRRAGTYEGSHHVSSITLAADGTYDATIDGQAEHGTWWDGRTAGLLGGGGGVPIACTSARHAFSATLDDEGTVTIRWTADDRETLTMRR